MLRLTFAHWALGPLETDPSGADFYRAARSFGYEGVEMAPPAHYAMIGAAGLALTNTNGTKTHAGLNRLNDQPAALAEIRASIAHARQNKIPALIVFAGPRQNQPLQIGIQNCITALTQLAPDAQRVGVTLLLEPFNQIDHPDYDCDSCDYAFTVARAVNSPAVKVLFDLYHMQRMKQDLRAAIEKHLDLIGHFHIAGSPERNFPAQPSTSQEMDYQNLVKLASARGYAGTWGMEFLPGADRLDELKRAAELFQSYAH